MPSRESLIQRSGRVARRGFELPNIRSLTKVTASFSLVGLKRDLSPVFNFSGYVTFRKWYRNIAIKNSNGQFFICLLHTLPNIHRLPNASTNHQGSKNPECFLYSWRYWLATSFAATTSRSGLVGARYKVIPHFANHLTKSSRLFGVLYRTEKE